MKDDNHRTGGGDKMKVILTAFQDKLRSEPMEFPDEIGREIHLMLDVDKTEWSFKVGGEIPTKSNLKRGKFIEMAHSELLSDNKTFARRYTLVELL